MEIEETIRTHAESGRLAEAATLAVESYGPEVLGFLVAFLKDPDLADDVFSQTCEDLWSGFAQFEWRSSLRTWIYVLARHAAHRLQRSPHTRAEHRRGISEISHIAAQVRSRTSPHLRTEVKDAFAKIRDALDPDDRALLVLRIDRRMDWADVTRVLYPEESARSDKDLARLTARLRKRFERVKDDVREKAREAGLLSS